VLGQAIALALVAAFSPWTLLIVAYLLTQPRPKRLALVFLASAAAITLAIGFAVVVTLVSTGADDSRKHRSVPPALDVAVGVAILVFAAVVWRRPPREKKARERETGILGVITLGAAIGSPSPIYLSSLHTIAEGHPSAVTITLDVLLISVLVLLMIEAPIVMYFAAPQRTTAMLKSANAWLAAHGRVIAVTAATVVGTYFVVNGIHRLL
jgi:hypothetical protein